MNKSFKLFLVALLPVIIALVLLFATEMRIQKDTASLCFEVVNFFEGTSGDETFSGWKRSDFNNADNRRKIIEAIKESREFILKELTVDHVENVLSDSEKKEYSDLEKAFRKRSEFLERMDEDGKVIEVLKIAAVSIIFVFLLYVIIILTCGKLAKNRRELLLIFFSFGLYSTAVLCISITVANALVLIGSIYYAEAYFLGWVHIGVIISFCIATFVVIIIILKSIRKIFVKPKSNEIAENLSRQEYPQIWEFVKDISQKMRSKIPDNIIAGLEPTFYATQMDITLADKELKGETLFISLTLARILSISELKSIIGHELAHFSSDDVKYTTRFYPIYTGAYAAINNLSEESSIITLPAISLFIFFISCFEGTERFIGRKRELSADLLSANINEDVSSSATALIKVYKYASVYGKVVEAAWEEVSQNNFLLSKNLSVSFINEAKKLPKKKLLKTCKQVLLIIRPILTQIF